MRQTGPDDVFRVFHYYKPRPNGSLIPLGLFFVCPACSAHYGYVEDGWVHHVNLFQPDTGGKLWRAVNGNGEVITADNVNDVSFEGLTVNPSLGFIRSTVNGEERWDCHSLIKGGRIEYQADSLHAMAGQTVDIRPFRDYPRFH